METVRLLQAALIGVLEGLTEFLPVSSTGHILLLEELIGFEGPQGKVFEVVIQFGAILAVIWLYRIKLWQVATGTLRGDPLAVRFAAVIATAFLPAAIVGVALHRIIKTVLFNPWVVAVALIAGGVAIIIIERLAPRPRIKAVDDVRLGTALKIGLCQCIAMIPGVSRSGATIMSARAFGVDRAAAAEFSFFLAIPTMLGATVYDAWRNWSTLAGDAGAWAIIVVGFAAAFVTALLVVSGLVRFVSRYGFTVFAWYRIGLGAVALVLLTVQFLAR
jgi:undecaprenyl-diphosphatase